MACPDTSGGQYAPLEEKKVLGRVNADVGHLAESIQFPALTGYSPQSRRDAQKKEPVAVFGVTRVAAVGLLQKGEHSAGASGGEIAGGQVRYEAAVGPRDLAPSGLMLAQPLQTFGCSLVDDGGQTVKHATCSQRNDIL